MTLFELRPTQRPTQPQRPTQRRGLNSHLDPAIWPLSAYVDGRGRLRIGGVAATDIAAEFGTPTHVVDAEGFRARIRGYRAALPGAELIYAGKALLSSAVAGWAAAEGAGVGVCSGAELAIALAGGVPPSRLILHGDAKTPAELADAVAAGVGRVVIDCPSEIALLAGRARRRQRREILGGTGQPAAIGRHRTRDDSGAGLAGRGRDRPRRRTARRPSPRRSAGGGVHRRLSPLDGIEPQSGGPPPAGRRCRRPVQRTGAPRKRGRSAGPRSRLAGQRALGRRRHGELGSERWLAA